MKHFVENLDYGEGTFLEKLENQLAPAPAPAKQLAAEMFWVMYLFPMPRSMQPGTKRQQIRQVWEWSGEQLPHAPFELDEALEHGIGNPGMAYGTHRWRELRYFIRIMEGWTAMRTPQQEARLADPWNLAKWLEEQDETGSRQLRDILLYMLFPDHFEPFASASQKERIVRAFGRRFGEELEALRYKDRISLDRQIVAIRERLQGEGAAPDFDFHDEPYLKVWRPEFGQVPAGQAPQENPGEWYRDAFGAARVWVFAPGAGAQRWSEFQEEAIIAIGWDEIGDLRGFDDKQEIHKRLQGILEKPDPKHDALACYQFAREMQVGDYVVAKQGRRLLLGHGVIESDYKFDESRPEFKHVRRVRWERTGRWQIPKSHAVATKTLTDRSSDKHWLWSAFRTMEGVDNPEKPDPEPYTRRRALDGLFLSEAKFDDIIDALERKKNIVLEGSPGVGKTFIAKRLAYRLIGYKIPERVQMIQFHQSYSYEDFIQGYRPKPNGGFELRNGSFLSFCRLAIANPGNRYVFIVDEVNRGNLSKIFGEVMMLIEADKRGQKFAIPLTYSLNADTFYVPENLYLIGMMNTADRSLAMVDYALRRRFAFIRLPPAFGADQFSDFLIASGVPEELVATINVRLSQLNREIREDRSNLGPGFEIGHSFFCPGEDDGDLDNAWYEAIIRREIEPLLREYWFDRPERVDKAIRDLRA